MAFKWHMPRILAFVSSAPVALLLSCHVVAADIDELRTLWQAGEYQAVLPQLLNYQDQPYGRNEEVFYMIGTSACRIAGMQELGARCFQWMLDNYRLDEDSRRKVKKEAEICLTTERPIMVVLAAGHRTTSGTAGISSKMFHWIDQKNVPLGDDSAKIVRQIDPAVFESRLFDVDEMAAAQHNLAKLAGRHFRVVARPPFVLASAGPHSISQLESIGDELAKVVDFYSAQYGMPGPSHMISVYLVPSVHQLRKMALRLHGIEITDSSIGYSYRDDMSLLGVIPTQTIGTLKHELFHLLVRKRFGDIPPWLDEGMAALYEVSSFNNATLEGRPNWRGPVLERYWDLRPRIAELVASDWPTFDAETIQANFKSKLHKQAANHATARYFILYLQDQNRLVDVYHTMQARSPLADTHTVLTSTDALTQLLGQDLDQVDQAFADWFNRLVAAQLDRKDVERYQRHLAAMGYDPKGVDGIMGSNTRRAIRAYQLDHGLTVNGQLDLYTRKALLKQH
jgi:hypothetical protein